MHAGKASEPLRTNGNVHVLPLRGSALPPKAVHRSHGIVAGLGHAGEAHGVAAIGEAGGDEVGRVGGVDREGGAAVDVVVQRVGRLPGEREGLLAHGGPKALR